MEGGHGCDAEDQEKSSAHSNVHVSVRSSQSHARWEFELRRTGGSWLYLIAAVKVVSSRKFLVKSKLFLDVLNCSVPAVSIISSITFRPCVSCISTQIGAYSGCRSYVRPHQCVSGTSPQWWDHIVPRTRLARIALLVSVRSHFLVRLIQGDTNLSNSFCRLRRTLTLRCDTPSDFRLATLHISADPPGLACI